jgi:hypothetical protein
VADVSATGPVVSITGSAGGTSSATKPNPAHFELYNRWGISGTKFTACAKTADGEQACKSITIGK